MNRHLKSGDLLLEPGDEKGGWRVMCAIPVNGTIKLFKRSTNTEENVSIHDIYRKVRDGALLHRRDSDPLVPPERQGSPAYTAELTYAQACLRKVETAVKTFKCSFNRAYQTVLHEHRTSVTESGREFPSIATLYRYRDAKLQERALLVGSRNKGRRERRYDEAVDGVIYDLAKQLYLVPGSRWRLNRLHELINDRLHDAQLLSPGATVSQKYVQQVIRQRLTIDPDAERMDPKKVSGARSIGAKRIQVFNAFERVEQDALNLPFYVKTPDGISSNVWVVHAIDCATSMVVGWHLVLGSPSETDGLRCVHSILNSKVDALAALGIECKYDIYGTPSLLAFDNGPEAKGSRMARLSKIGIEPENGRSRTPQRRPFIERLNRSLKDALETLPGCTRFNGEDGQRDPIALGDRLMTLEELHRWLVRWYFEKWANEPLERLSRTLAYEETSLGSTPAKRWKALSEQCAFVMPLPVSADAWRNLLYERTIRKLSRKTGITHNGLNYKGQGLVELIHRVGESPVTVLADPDDYRFIYVDLGPNERLVTLHEEFVDEFSLAYSVQEYKALLAQQRSDVEEHEDAVRFRRDIQAASRVEQKRPARKSTLVNRETQRKARESAARRKAIANPLVRDLPPQESVSLDDWGSGSVEALPILDRKDGRIRP